MFCPRCGKADQSPESYCRQCGVFLPDLSKPFKTAQTPQQHVTANIVLSIMTILASFTLAILLWSMLGFRESTHPLIYVTAGLLFAMGCWHIQTLLRALMLRKHFKKDKLPRERVLEPKATAGRQLDVPDYENKVPASVTDHTTRPLAQRKGELS